MSECAIISRARAEPLAGTATTARTWLLIEQPGPWGGKALTESRLDPGLGRALEAAAEGAGTGVRVALIRRPRRDGERAATRRRVWLAHTSPGAPWIRTTELGDDRAARDLLGLDFPRLGAGHHDGLWEPHRGGPLTLVCTNGKRDRCCAVLGRPLAAEIAAAGGAEVWEITHIGGHRFSPTLLTLPHGYAYGRMTAIAVKGVLAALQDGRVVTEHCRGRSTWDRPGQAAELAVRELTGEEAADALTVETGPRHGAAWSVTVVHRDGRRWRVGVAEEAADEPAPASCGAAFTPQPALVITSADPLP
ncbi:sucrase ferredoxin [Streptomyces sp. NBC_01803]|uniref:sucrase ferredoxin n=1 Tax=Streptomyces sp. NBC_01803 TaxID=2975946 RepID=UPI002DD909DA|nr:sucrase ferredoxin [Streptomyces sp. NBC_01803]WSA43856.1 sucrase ferredoxin [Streptomyces sp. NBC_01803]